MPEKHDDILLIHYKFPPVKSIGAIRNYQVTRQFRCHFREVHIITTQNRSFLPQEPLPGYEQFDIHPVLTWDYRRITRFLHRDKPLLPGNHSDNPVLSGLLRLRDSFPFSLLLDEGGISYILSAYFRGCRLIKKHRIRYLYSSFRPYADHLAAYLLKLRFPHLVWIADYRDPHVDLNRDPLFFPPLQHAFNRHIMQRADLVTTVSAGLARYFRRYCGRVYVLRNGISRQPPFLPASVPSQKLTITYTGSIYQDKQRADLLMSTLREMIDGRQIPARAVRLVYAGKDTGIWTHWLAHYGLEDISTAYAQLELPEALRLQRQSDINLLLSWSGPEIKGILTGKLYDYLAARKPILAIINGERDPEFEQLFQQTGAGLVTYHQQPTARKALAAFLKNHYRRRQRGEADTPFFPKEKLAPFYWDALFERFLEYLEEGELVARKRGALVETPHPNPVESSLREFHRAGPSPF